MLLNVTLGVFIDGKTFQSYMIDTSICEYYFIHAAQATINKGLFEKKAFKLAIITSFKTSNDSGVRPA